MKTFILAADTVNGVYEIEALPQGESTYSFEVFYENLDAIKDGETLYTIANEQEAQAVDTYYGVEFIERDMADLDVMDVTIDKEHGFFIIEFTNLNSLQCCLVSFDSDGEHGGYENKIEIHHCGFDEGTSADANAWAIDWYGKDEVREYLREAAIEEGLEII